MKFLNWIRKQGGPRALAPKLGVDWRTIHYWMRGRSTPKASRMRELVNMGKGSFDYLDIIKDTQRGKKK